MSSAPFLKTPFSIVGADLVFARRVKSPPNPPLAKGEACQLTSPSLPCLRHAARLFTPPPPGRSLLTTGDQAPHPTAAACRRRLRLCPSQHRSRGVFYCDPTVAAKVLCGTAYFASSDLSRQNRDEDRASVQAPLQRQRHSTVYSMRLLHNSAGPASLGAAKIFASFHRMEKEEIFIFLH